MRKNRFIGNFVGNLAALPRQDSHEGLPLALLPEEATLMVEKELADFKEVPSLSTMPADGIRQESQSYRNEILSEQVGLLKDMRKKEIEKNIKQIVEGKKRKRMTDALEALTDEELEKQILKEECDRVQDPKPSVLSVQIFTSDPWIKLDDYVDAVWRYPETDEDRLHYFVYKDLWEQGFFVTSGKKFGADYLVYPGDPVKFHSFFIVVCVDKKRQFTPAEIIMRGRLGQSVRKTFVLAYLSDDDKVNYQSVQWTGK
ncbi:UNVERIFIED_CONTAM: hypothetical protein PYX00_003233 [Menopon gallinae]